MRLFFLMALFLLPFALQAEEVHVAKAGTLGALLNYNTQEITGLTISGYLNGDDIKVIRDMPELSVLDISGASIVKGGSGPYYTEDNKITTLMFYSLGLTSIRLPNNITFIGAHAFSYCRGLTSIAIPKNVTVIDEYAFYNCSGLKDIVFPKNLDSIGEAAFYGCAGLTELTFPKKLKTIGNFAFQMCTGLIDIEIPNGVTTIGRQTFANCTGLVRVVFPKSLTHINSAAFYACANLTDMYSNNPVPPKVAQDSFYLVDRAVCRLFVARKQGAAYRNANGWKEFENITEYP